MYDLDVSADAPTFDVAMSSIKLLLECAVVSPDLGHIAKQLAENLIDEDDEVVEVWFLLGIACSSLQPVADITAAIDAFEMAKCIMDKIREGLLEEAQREGKTVASSENDIFPYDSQYQLVLEHLAALEKLDNNSNNNVGISNSVDGGKMKDEDEEWSDCDEDEQLNCSDSVAMDV